MLKKGCIVAPVILLISLWAVLSACGNRSPAAPSHVQSPPSPTPTAQVSSVWDLTARLTAASGGECVGEAVQSQIGEVKSYSLSITQTGSKVDVTLTSTSGDYACTFTGGRTDGNGFAFGASDGWFSCERGGEIRGYRCANGAQRDLFSLGQNLFASITGDEISGTWTESRAVALPGQFFAGEVGVLETTTEFAGSRRSP